MARTRIDILPAAYLMCALLLLIFPLKWLLAWMTAAAIHELCHVLAIRFCNGGIRMIRIGAFGADIQITPMPPGKEILCALAGPAGGLLILPLFRWMPYISLLALLQSVYNLLPIYPLDGGRALRCALEMMAGEYLAGKISGVCNKFVLGALVFIGLLAYFHWNLGLIALFLPVLLSIKFLPRKIPCKRKSLGLQ